jgi:hypothetical protein
VARKSPARKPKRRSLIRIPQEYQEAIDLGHLLFPWLFEFENGFRLLLHAYLSDLYGSDWWALKVQPGLPTVFKYSEDQRAKMDAMPWIGDSTRVKVLPVHLVTLGQLEEIVRKYRSECIPELFPSIEFFIGHLEVIKRVRNLYAHMFPCITKADCDLAKREIKTLGTHINDRLQKYAVVA